MLCVCVCVCVSVCVCTCVYLPMLCLQCTLPLPFGAALWDRSNLTLHTTCRCTFVSQLWHESSAVFRLSEFVFEWHAIYVVLINSLFACVSSGVCVWLFVCVYVCVCDQLQDEERRRKQQLEEIRKREAEERANQEERRWREESKRDGGEKVGLSICETLGFNDVAFICLQDAGHVSFWYCEPVHTRGQSVYQGWTTVMITTFSIF